MLASGRLVLLHDPEGQDGWDGVLRLVMYVRAELDRELATDPFLPAVGWSWLTDALEVSGASWTALGGTVTETSSARFGDISGPTRTDDLELRASWTPTDAGLLPHGQAFCQVMASVVGPAAGRRDALRAAPELLRASLPGPAAVRAIIGNESATVILPRRLPHRLLVRM